MKAIDRLKRDPVILRAKLDILESAVGMGPRMWFVLREVCFTLATQLRDHLHREEELIAACRKALSAEALARLAIEHRDEPEHLRTINQLFIQERSQALEQIRPALTGFIHGLRHHMDDEETALFPTLERVLGAEEAAEALQPATPYRLNEMMTVNRVVQEYPRTKPVFERFFINVPFEGCHCLDEVAWRHGMESKELLSQLEDALAQ